MIDILLTKKSACSGCFMNPGFDIEVIPQNNRVIEPRTMFIITISEYLHSIIIQC